MIIRPLFSFGTLKGPIPLLHVWSSYISALTDMFSKFLPFISRAAATKANIASRVPTSCKHGNKRSGSITKRKRRRQEREFRILLVVYCRIQTWKWKYSSFFLSLSPLSLLCSCIAAIMLNAHTRCYQWITNQTLRSLAKTKLSHRLKWELVSCQCTRLKNVTRRHKHPLVQKTQSNLTYIKDNIVFWSESLCFPWYLRNN